MRQKVIFTDHGKNQWWLRVTPYGDFIMYRIIQTLHGLGPRMVFLSPYQCK